MRLVVFTCNMEGETEWPLHCAPDFLTPCTQQSPVAAAPATPLQAASRVVAIPTARGGCACLWATPDHVRAPPAVHPLAGATRKRHPLQRRLGSFAGGMKAERPVWACRLPWRRVPLPQAPVHEQPVGPSRVAAAIAFPC